MYRVCTVPRAATRAVHGSDRPYNGRVVVIRQATRTVLLLFVQPDGSGRGTGRPSPGKFEHSIIKNIVAVKRGGCNPSNRPRTVVPSPSKREEGGWTPPCTVTVKKGERRGLPLLVPSPSKSTPPCTVAVKERGDLLEPSPSKKEREDGVTS
jgi:hypothetical protein